MKQAKIMWDSVLSPSMNLLLSVMDGIAQPKTLAPLPGWDCFASLLSRSREGLVSPYD